VRSLLQTITILLFTMFVAAPCAAAILETKNQQDVESFLSGLKTKDALLSFDKNWAQFSALGASGVTKSLKALIQNRGPVTKYKLLEERTGGGGRIVRLKYALSFKSRSSESIEFSYLKRLNSPYSLYDIKVGN
jgi:hypothetical protein